MSLYTACGKQRNVDADDGRMKIMNWHLEFIWAGRKHSALEFALWNQTVQAQVPAPPLSAESS